MTRKEIQQQLQGVIYRGSGSSDRIEIVGNIGINYHRGFGYLGIVVALPEASDKLGNFEYEEFFFQGEDIENQFGDILNNSERIRWNKIRKFVKEVI